VEREGFEPSKV